MALDQQELFQKLLQQLNLEDQATTAPYATGAITAMTVHEKSRTWSFGFLFEDILPFETFMDFTQRLNQAFSEIATIDFQIATRTAQPTLALIDRYWQWAVSHSGLNDQFARQLCDGPAPVMQGETIVITAPNQVVSDFLNGETLSALTATYQRLGFPALTFATTVDEAASAQRLAEHEAEKAKRDEEMVTKATAVHLWLCPVRGGGMVDGPGLTTRSSSHTPTPVPNSHAHPVPVLQITEQ